METDSSDEGATLLFSIQGTINAKNLRKSHFSPSDRGLACLDEGYNQQPSPGALLL